MTTVCDTVEELHLVLVGNHSLGKKKKLSALAISFLLVYKRDKYYIILQESTRVFLAEAASWTFGSLSLQPLI